MSTQVNRVTAFQQALAAMDRVDYIAPAYGVNKKDLELIRYALRSGYIKALIENTLTAQEKQEFDELENAKVLAFFAEEDKHYVY